MKLPIHLSVEKDTVWTTYKAERDACNTVDDLQRFVQRWKDIFPFKLEQVVLNEDVLKTVKSENPDEQDIIATNIILPHLIFSAMMKAKELVVPLNTAFIQSNGGLGNFEG